MPAKSRFRLRTCVIEVAPRLGLRGEIRRGLRRFGPMTALELANLAYWGRSPNNYRLGARWWANRSQKSATRRAIAELRRRGQVVGHRWGRRTLYFFNHAGGQPLRPASSEKQ